MLERVRIDLKIMISIDKERSGRPAAMKENELRKDGKKSWKIMENTSINSYCIDFFYCNKKIVKNQEEELLHQSNNIFLNIKHKIKYL